VKTRPRVMYGDHTIREIAIAHRVMIERDFQRRRSRRLLNREERSTLSRIVRLVPARDCVEISLDVKLSARENGRYDEFA